MFYQLTQIQNAHMVWFTKQSFPGYIAFISGFGTNQTNSTPFRQFLIPGAFNFSCEYILYLSEPERSTQHESLWTYSLQTFILHIIDMHGTRSFSFALSSMSIFKQTNTQLSLFRGVRFGPKSDRLAPDGKICYQVFVYFYSIWWNCRLQY